MYYLRILSSVTFKDKMIHHCIRMYHVSRNEILECSFLVLYFSSWYEVDFSLCFFHSSFENICRQKKEKRKSFTITHIKWQKYSRYVFRILSSDIWFQTEKYQRGRLDDQCSRIQNTFVCSTCVRSWGNRCRSKTRSLIFLTLAFFFSKDNVRKNRRKIVLLEKRKRILVSLLKLNMNLCVTGDRDRRWFSCLVLFKRNVIHEMEKDIK